MEKNKLVFECFLQLSLEPRELLSGYLFFLSGKLRVEKNKKCIAIGKRIIWFLKKVQIDRERFVTTNIMIAGREMECFIRSCEFKKPCPLARATGCVDGVSHMNDLIDFLFFHYL